MDAKFLLINDHPHAGELCEPKGESEETISTMEIGGVTMYLMRLINCQHGTKECYARKSQLKLMEDA